MKNERKSPEGCICQYTIAYNLYLVTPGVGTLQQRGGGGGGVHAALAEQRPKATCTTAAIPIILLANSPELPPISPPLFCAVD